MGKRAAIRVIISQVSNMLRWRLSSKRGKVRAGQRLLNSSEIINYPGHSRSTQLCQMTGDQDVNKVINCRELPRVTGSLDVR